MNMNKEVEGIIIREKDYGDTSKIIDIFTKEYGIIGVIAKGSKSMKSKLRSVTTKFTYGIFNIYYKEGKLSTLKEVDIINNFNNIRKDINLIVYSTYLLDLSEQVYKQNNSIDIYNLLINTLIKINDKFDYIALINIVELKYLDYLGVMFEVDRCSVCGNTNIITLSSDKGGYICSNCRTYEKVLDNKILKLIRMFYYVDISKIDKLNISNEISLEISEFLNNYYDRYTGLYLKSKKFLNNLKNIQKRG